VEARITNYGGIVVSLKTPDRTGAIADVVLGCGADPYRRAAFGGRHSVRLSVTGPDRVANRAE